METIERNRFGGGSWLVLLVISLFVWTSTPGRSAEPAGASLVDEAAKAFDAGERERAFKLLDEAVKSAPDPVQPLYVRARLYAIDGQSVKAIADLDRVLELNPKAAMAWHHKGTENFKLGRMKEAVADYDRYLALVPGEGPRHWQRGIACYYAGEFDQGRRQFESHQKVNPEDVENSVWHFLCVSRASGVDAARAALMPVRSDRRVPMMQILALFEGKGSVEDVMAAVNAGAPPQFESRQRLFYAHLYLGLYFEALGDENLAREHIFKAADEYRPDHFMGDVARAHARILRETGTPRAAPPRRTLNR